MSRIENEAVTSQMHRIWDLCGCQNIPHNVADKRSPASTPVQLLLQAATAFGISLRATKF